MALWRVLVEGRARLAVGPVGGGPAWLLDPAVTLDALLSGPPGAFGRVLVEARAASAEAARAPVPSGAPLLAPVEGQPVWAAGVTFRRSREARLEESGGLDAYDKVYEAARPELFFKALPGAARGPGEPVGVRADSDWNVPEPELALVADARGEIVAYTAGNDVSSRSIEGENPLYLPQAKVYEGSCALGPCLVPLAEAPALAEMRISLAIERGGHQLFSGACEVADMRRTPGELVGWLYRALRFPVGAVLLTGTSIVPPPEVSLLPGDLVRVAVSGLGELANPVEAVGFEFEPAPTEAGV
jgi:2-dehydro-3-deoxy-D-arabinonate dehydratase